MAHTLTALVTGAYKGIGQEVARQLTTRGFHVFLTARNLAAGAAAAERIRSKGGKVDFIPLDVTDPSSICHAVETVGKLTDHLDVLVNNAGLLLDREGTVLDLSLDQLRRSLETNAMGPLQVTQAFLPLLSKSEAARIINVSSSAGQLIENGGWAPGYSISKTALNGVTVQLAVALKEKGISVNSVCPGWIRTDMGGSAAPGTVEEGADTIVWLATDAPAGLTGKFVKDREVKPW